MRKWILNAFHKLDKNVKGPIPIDESVNAQLEVLQGLTEADSGKFLTHHGDNDTWF